ncbi:MAG: hypothetical protein ABS897_03950 [Eubacteriales bacterium]
MRKAFRTGISLALAAALAFSLAAGLAESETAADTRVIRARQAAEEGGADALLELASNHYTSGVLRQDGYAEVYIWQPDGPSTPVQYMDDYPLMNLYTAKMQETAGVGFTLEQLLVYNISASGNYLETDITEYYLPNGPVHIDPYGTFSLQNGSPARMNGNREIIVAAGTDDNGHPLEFYGVMQLLNVQPDSLAGNVDYDTDNLRYDADFEVEVADGVWWVPARALGDSRYTNREIAAMVEHTPEEKQAEISTLYEAVQLFQISNFTYTGDNVDLWEGTIKWEHHKPGYHAVRTNTGCCAADTSWLNYILSGDYERLGIIGTAVVDDDGHAFNYIFRDGYYYFIDLTCYEAEYIKQAAPETGNMSDYRNANPVGCVLKAKDPEVFVKYYIDHAGNVPALVEIYESEYCLPTAQKMVDGQLTFYLPEGYDIQIIEGRSPQKIDMQFVKAPDKTNPWKGLRSARFRVDPKYLGEGAADPLTEYKPGDVLALQYHVGDTTAVIGGTDYTLGGTNRAGICFEANVFTVHNEPDGFNYDLGIPADRYGEELKEMDSLVVGELTAETDRTVPETQLLICTREGEQLTVREVMNGKYYDTRKIVITKDGDGNWTETPEYWYLWITKDQETGYEFNWFRCGVSGDT